MPAVVDSMVFRAPLAGSVVVESRTTHSITLVERDDVPGWERQFSLDGDNWQTLPTNRTITDLTAGNFYSIRTRFVPMGRTYPWSSATPALNVRTVPNAPSISPDAQSRTATSITFRTAGANNVPSIAPSQFQWQYQWRVYVAGQDDEDGWNELSNLWSERTITVESNQIIEVRRRFQRGTGVWDIPNDSYWSPLRTIEPETTAHTVTFNLNGGAVGANNGPITVDIDDGDTIGIGNVPVPTHPLYWLEGWQEDGSGPVLSPETVAGLTVTGPRNFTPVWRGFTVTFVSGVFGTGADVVWNDVPRGTIIGTSAGFTTIPTFGPVTALWSFGSWAASNPVGHEVTANVTFTARWNPIITIEVDEDGDITVIAPPEVDYTLGTDADGNPTVTFPENPD